MLREVTLFVQLIPLRLGGLKNREMQRTVKERGRDEAKVREGKNGKGTTLHKEIQFNFYFFTIK